MAVTLPCHAALRRPMQLPINLRSQLLQSTFIALAPCLKQFRNLVSEGLIHLKPLHRKGEVQGAVTANISTGVGSFGALNHEMPGTLPFSVTGVHRSSRCMRRNARETAAASRRPSTTIHHYNVNMR